MAARFIHPQGYTLRPTGEWQPGAGYLLGLTALVGIRRKRKQYEFTLDAQSPLTFAPNPVLYIRPDRHGLTDLGSIPEQLEPFICRSRFEPSFILHDSACVHQGLYFSATYDGPYTFCRISSHSAAKLLRKCVRAEGAFWHTAALVFRAVDRFGPQWDVADSADT